MPGLTGNGGEEYTTPSLAGSGVEYTMPLDMADPPELALIDLDDLEDEIVYICWPNTHVAEGAVFIRRHPQYAWQVQVPGSDKWSEFLLLDSDHITLTYTALQGGYCAECRGPTYLTDYLCGICRA